MSVDLPVVVRADQRRAALPALILGGLCVVAGGLVAAATAPVPSEKGSWVAAYLVLVGGVAQIAFGVGLAAFGRLVPARTVGAEALCWNAGNALVVAGTLAGVPALADVGGVLLLAALVLLVPSLRTPAGSVAARARWLLYAYRVVVLVLLVSIPVGLALAAFRA